MEFPASKVKTYAILLILAVKKNWKYVIILTDFVTIVFYNVILVSHLDESRIS